MLSSALVASSKISSLGLGAMARAIISRCFCPPEMPPAPSEIMVCMPMGMSRMSSASPASSAASQASASVRPGAEMAMFSNSEP